MRFFKNCRSKNGASKGGNPKKKWGKPHAGLLRQRRKTGIRSSIYEDLKKAKAGRPTGHPKENRSVALIRKFHSCRRFRVSYQAEKDRISSGGEVRLRETFRLHGCRVGGSNSSGSSAIRIPALMQTKQVETNQGGQRLERVGRLCREGRVSHLLMKTDALSLKAYREIRKNSFSAN